MGDNKEQSDFLEDLIGIVTEVLNHKNQPSTVNPPTPSLNISQEESDKFIITKEESEQLLNLLKELGSKLEQQEKTIESLKQERKETEQLLRGVKELEVELKQKENIIEDLNQNLEDDVEGGIEVDRKKDKDKDMASGLDYSFRDDLEKHISNLDFVTIVITAGKDCCDISGHLCRICSDFITLVNDNNDLIKIPIDKIAAIKISSDGGGKRKYDKDNLDNDEESEEYSKVNVEEEQEENYIAAEDEEEQEIAVAENDELQRQLKAL